MSVKFCNWCERNVDAKRKIGVGTYILICFSVGLWLLAIPFYKQRCSICNNGTSFGRFRPKS